MDILPSTMEDENFINSLQVGGIPFDKAEKSIAITEKQDNTNYSWLWSNPRGYAEWFDEIKKEKFVKIASLKKKILLEKYGDIYESIEQIPDQLVKTPLQRAIQILKRHRDASFINNDLESDKPSSIVITTAAAYFYNDENDTVTALLDLLQNMSRYF